MHKLTTLLCSAVLSVSALAAPAFAEEGQAAPVSGAQAPETASENPVAADSGTPMAEPASPATAQSRPLQTPKSQNALSEPDTESAQSNPADPYAVKTFFADFKRFTLGDVVPDIYRSKKYIVSDWKTRHLPEPQQSSHWTYMGGNYVLIGDADGRILDAKSGEIFYRQ